MQYRNIPAMEQRFKEDADYVFVPVRVPVKGTSDFFECISCTPKMRSGYYYDTVYPKERIVLHFTAGYLKGDIETLTRQNFHVSVAFVIARDGTIYQLFPSVYWSCHLGKGIGNEGYAQDKATIGIEISNIGYLVENDGGLESIYSRVQRPDGFIAPEDVYCSLKDKAAYKKLRKPFREQKYFATCTDAQYSSLVVLLRYLSAQYNIPYKFLPVSKRYAAHESVLGFRGIVSHVNYRPAGKWDIGPAFDWKRLKIHNQAPAG